MTEVKNQNGTVHSYDYDLLGRQTHDRVTTVGTGIDGGVRRISSTFEVRGPKADSTSSGSSKKTKTGQTRKPGTSAESSEETT